MTAQKKLSPSRALAAKVIYAGLSILRDNGKELPMRDLMEKVEKKVDLNKWEKEISHRPDEPFPTNWSDEPLLLMGKYLEVLNLTDDEKIPYRKFTLNLIEHNGPQWVWENRERMAAEIEFIRNF